MPDDIGDTRLERPESAATATSMSVPLLTTDGSTSPASAGEQPGALRVMTYNLKVAHATGSNRWAVRRPVMRDLLRRERPHVIGTQEGRYRQLRSIEKDIGPHYDWIGIGRMGGRKSEFAAVFYDTERLKPVQFDHYWLSDTPSVIASNTWGADLPRVVTWVRFSDLGREGREFYVLNTHLDHRSQYARERSVELIGETIAAFDSSLPVVVTGDFNVAAHDNQVYDAMLALGLVDTWNAARACGPLYGTFNGFRPPEPGGQRIDWILTTPRVTTHCAAINTFAMNGRLPSDHLPVQATLELGKHR
ncbi:endonuclease/exonuclease/phosphatase family protein [Streptomyces sp. Tu102]|uniref:endonuclease/exonuclease/phosphatase family protein n=1 Tax=Streptomyces sp. Tu102 TaxID=2838019 RepID=UPI0027E50AD1|nr:endonuclease/exonuclease/phosphatase family protein [Streptomyces sp. Tu102]